MKMKIKIKSKQTNGIDELWIRPGFEIQVDSQKREIKGERGWFAVLYFAVL